MDRDRGEVTCPSGLTYRLNGSVLEVQYDGQWIEADQVNAEDCVALMTWWLVSNFVGVG